MKNNKIWLILTVIVVILAFTWGVKVVLAPKPIVADFISTDGKSALVSFNNENRTATLDGAGYSKLVFAQGISASGARYVNEAENLVLWNKGDEITLYKGEEVLFQGKVFNPESQNNEQQTQDNDLYVFAGPTWIWQETQFNDGKIVKPKKAGMFTLTFNSAEGRVSGKTDCNGFGGSYTAGAGNVLSFGPFMSTLMFCEDSQEAEFVKMVNDSNQYTFTTAGDLVLMLKLDSGSVIFKKQ